MVAELIAAASPASALLEAQGLSASYGPVEVVRSVDLRLARGEMVAILGANGAGKSTLLRTLMGLMPRSRGRILFAGEEVQGEETRLRTRRGMVLVPEGRGIFAPMTVRENLELGAYLLGRNAAEFERRLDTVFALFPRLRDRQAQASGSLSGGEQQMLAIGRALMGAPVLLMLDEPSLGLAPRMASEIMGKLGELNRAGLTVLLVEQKAPLALRLADRAYVLAGGRVVAEATPAELGTPENLAKLYFAAGRA